MRKRRFQRRNRRLLVSIFLVFLILIIGCYIYIDLRGEFLLRDFKKIVEKALSQTFKAELSIGDVRGGIFYPVTFSDVVLYDSFEGRYKIFQANELRINYHLWDLFFNRRKRVCRMHLFSPTFFILPKEYKNATGPSGVIPTGLNERGASFLTRYAQLDIVDGSIVLYDTKNHIVTKAKARVTLSPEAADLKEATLNFYKLPVSIEGKVEGLYSESPRLDMALKTQNDYAEVIMHAQGFFHDMVLDGTLKVTNGSEVGLGGRFQWPNISLNGNLKHWTVGAVDLSTNIKLEAEFKETASSPAVTGSLDTTNTIINYRPGEELSMQFALRKKVIEILGLKWGRSLRLVGKFQLGPPNNIEVIALLDGMKIEEFTSFGGESLQEAVSGTVKGRLEIEGPLASCVSRGHITARNGNIGDVYYENAAIHLVGKGPLITIGDSRIYRETGYLLMNGEIDLEKLGKRNVFEDVIVETDDQSIVWEGWDISKEVTTDQVSLKKRINEELEIGFKAPLEPQSRLDDEGKEGELELRYKLRGNESLKMKLKQEEEFLGVEHKIKF